MIYILFIYLLNFIFSQVHFTDIPNDTGIYHPVIIEECIGLDIGDEIGLFDSNGLISSDCSDEYGEILVGSGVYDGTQITISGIGSFNFCDLNDGYQLPGWVDNNAIKIMVWDASQDIEYIPEVNYTTGSGNWGDVFSVIDTLVVNELSIDPIDDFSILEIYPNPFNSYTTFRFNLDLNQPIIISVFNIYGYNIDTYSFNNPNNSIVWDASNYESGIYFLKFDSFNFSLTKKITLIK